MAEENNKTEEEKILEKISLERILKCLEKSEQNDTTAWWQLHRAMCVDRSEFEEEDIEKLSGWKVLDSATKKRIITCGKTFLVEQESNPKQWLGKRITYHPAVAGYRALRFFYKYEKNYIESLKKEVWKKWAPITVGMPLVSNDSENGQLIALAYQNAPDEIIQTLDSIIDEEEREYGSLRIISLLDHCIDERMSRFLLGKARKEVFNIKIKAAGDILRFLLTHLTHLQGREMIP